MEKKVHEKGTDRINYDVARGALPQGDEGLMVLVGDRIEHGDNGGNDERLAGNNKSANCPKDKQVKDCVLGYMGPFLDKKIKGAKV